MRYILYARKSQEDKNRQVQSIDDQVQELRRLAGVRGLTVIDELREARTAKAPGRPLFDAMLARIRAGEADGILVWSINRLVRNPVDQGSVQWMLQERRLLSVLTMDKEHTPEDNVLILGVEGGVANQFIIDLRKNTLRGMKSKVEQGWYPHRAPEGYLNDTAKLQGQRDIIIDPVRFPLLRQAWEMMLTGMHSVPQILRFLDRAGYRIKPHGKSLDGEMSRSALYRVFENPFYAGDFMYGGVVHQGRHPAMVTKAEFFRVQQIRNRSERQAPQKHVLAYGGGLMRCGLCGCQVCGDVKHRQTQGGVNVHTYYACANGKRICRKVGVTQQHLEDVVRSRLEEVSICPAYRPLLLDVWERYWQEAQSKAEMAAVLPQQALVGKKREQEVLLSLRLQERINDTQFEARQAELGRDIKALEEVVQVRRSRDGAAQTVNVLWFATEPKGRYINLGELAKRQICQNLGRWTLTNREVLLEWNVCLSPVRKYAKKFEKDCLAFERAKTGSASTEKAAFDRLCSIWGRRWDEIRTIILEHDIGFPQLML